MLLQVAEDFGRRRVGPPRYRVDGAAAEENPTPSRAACSAERTTAKSHRPSISKSQLLTFHGKRFAD